MNVGILGGGQLALMLCEAANKLRLKTLCLASSHSPASYVSETTEDMQKLIAHSQVIAIENEFLKDEDAHLLQEAPIKPNLQTIQLFSNKLEQKKLLDYVGLPTSHYIEKPLALSAKVWVPEVREKFLKGVVIKWGRMGYDGLGTYFLKDISDEKSAIDFVHQADQKNIPVYAEEMVFFDKEVAQVTAFSALQKEFYHFPLVETIQEKGICSRVYNMPLDDFSKTLEKKAQAYAEKLALSSHLVGTYAIEFFLKEGELLINEIAPRVHNSGHWSQISRFSQFEAHWQALLGRSFPKQVMYPPYFSMHNILGLPKIYKNLLKETKKYIDLKGNPSVYWYGKTEMRPRRKLGHICCFADNRKKLESIDKKAKQMRQQLLLDIQRKGLCNEKA